MRPLVISSLWIVFACLTVSLVSGAADQENSGAKQLIINVARLDPNTVILAFRSPAQSKRVVVGIARPMETNDEEAGHLYQIPGFKEAIPQQDLKGFREALERGISDKYIVHLIRLEGGATFPFDQIDGRFREYIQTATEEPGELEVLYVTLSASNTIRIVYLGDLVLVQPNSISNPQGKTEDAMVSLLTAIARDEKKGTQSIVLQGGCANAGLSIEEVRQNSLNVEARQSLRHKLSGVLTGSLVADNEYSVKNTGLVSHTLHLELAPESTIQDIQVKFFRNNEEGDITHAKTDIELPRCAEARISVAPRNWYNAFISPVNFTLSDAKLTANVPALVIQMGWIISAVVAIVILVGLLMVIFVKRGGRTVSITSDPERLPWWKFWKRWGKSSLIETNETTGIPPPGDPKRQPVASQTGSLDELLRKYKETNNAYQSLHQSMVEEVEKILPHINQADTTLEQLTHLREEHESWVKSLKGLGDSPKEINENFQTLRTGQKNLETKVLGIKGLLTGANDHPGEGAADIGKTLDELQEAVRKLEKRKADYQNLVERIIDALDPALKNGMDNILHGPDRLAEEVANLRRFTERIIRNFTEQLQTGAEDTNISSQSVQAIENRFDGLVKTRDALVRLRSDERVYRARLVSHGIDKAGKALLYLDKEAPQYADLLAKTQMELADLAQQLMEVAKTSQDTLTRTIFNQASSNKADDRLAKDNSVEVIAPFIEHLLSGTPNIALQNMLRLWQVMESYCQRSPIPLAKQLYSSGEVFRRSCKQILADFELLGIHFHPVRFLKNPRERSPEDPEWDFEEAEGIPIVQNSRQLFDPIITPEFENYWKTVADVSNWGLACELVPSQSRPTKLWRWKSDSKGSSDETISSDPIGPG